MKVDVQQQPSTLFVVPWRSTALEGTNNVTTFCPENGQAILIEAYLQLVREGMKAALVLIGRTTPYLNTVRSQVRKAGLQDYVFFIPDLDHPRTLAAIHKAKLLIQPSCDKPFGLPLLEAAYLRTLIVANNGGGIPEVLGGYYPYLVKPVDAPALARYRRRNFQPDRDRAPGVPAEAPCYRPLHLAAGLPRISANLGGDIELTMKVMTGGHQ